MANVIRKLRILFNLLGAAVEEWHSEIWTRDLDETYCCNGYECGCGAVTRGETYEWAFRNKKDQSNGR